MTLTHILITAGLFALPGGVLWSGAYLAHLYRQNKKNQSK